MSFIQDTDGTIFAGASDSTVSSPLSISDTREIAFAPCRFGRDMELLNITSVDDEGDFTVDDKLVALLDGYDFKVLALTNELESALNRAAQISVFLADYHSCHGGIKEIELLSGVEEMQRAAVAAAERISQTKSTGYEREM